MDIASNKTIGNECALWRDVIVAFQFGVIHVSVVFMLYVWFVKSPYLPPPLPAPLLLLLCWLYLSSRSFLFPSFLFHLWLFQLSPSAVDCVSLFIQFSIRNWNICVGIYASIYFPVSPLFTKVYSTFILNSPVQIFDTLHHLLVLVISDDDFRNGINTCNKMLCGGPTFFFWICFNLIVIDLKAPLTGLVCSTYNSVSYVLFRQFHRNGFEPFIEWQCQCKLYLLWSMTTKPGTIIMLWSSCQLNSF